MTKLALALDVADLETALELIEATDGFVDVYKVGLQLYLSQGPEILHAVKRWTDAEIFLDLKLYDIPNTMSEATKTIASMSIVDYLTIHGAAGGPAIEACVEAAKDKLKIAVITALTSQDVAQDYRESLIRKHSFSAWWSGVSYLVCAVDDIPLLRKLEGDYVEMTDETPEEITNHNLFFNPKYITPGIRLPGSDAHDQIHVATPQRAKELKSDMIVVGREITKAKDPRQAAIQIKDMLK